MMIKQVIIFFGVLSFSVMALVSYAEDKNESMEGMTHHHMKHAVKDSRVSLNLSPEMKSHQLSNMRAHLEAVQTIIGLVAEDKFEQASDIAHSKLGLTEEMRKMCNMFDNKNFTAMGLAFHESGDDLGEALKTKDTKKSLRALNTTVGYCVQCHATFRQ